MWVEWAEHYQLGIDDYLSSPLDLGSGVKGHRATFEHHSATCCNDSIVNRIFVS